MSTRSPRLPVGAPLRAARESRGLSLAQVADATGISKSALSLIETDRTDVPLSRLVRLAEFYGLRLIDLLPETGIERPVVVRRKERPRLYSRAEGLDIYLLTTDRTRAMLPVVGVFAPGGGAAEFASHEGEEFVLVLEGKLRLELEGSEPVVLDRGDSAHYQSDRPHRWSNVGKGIVRLVSVACPPHW